MIKTFKYKLYINNKNKFLHQQINISGIIYNYCINLHKRCYKLYGKSLNKFKLQKHLTKKKKLKFYNFWNLVGSQAIQDIVDRIDKSYKLFFRNLKYRIKTAPPSFKKVKKYKSFTLKQNCGYKLLENNKIKIQKKVYKYSKSREIEGKIKQVTVKRNNLGELFIYFVCEIENENKVETKKNCNKSIGFDFGLKTFLTSSDNEKIESPEFFKNSLGKLKKVSKNLSSKKKGSKNFYKAKRNLNLLHEKITNQRQDFFFKLANKLTKENVLICIEDLNLKGMQKFWGRKISDYSFSTFVKILEWEGLKNNCVIHKVDRFFPSSKTCSVCGSKKENLGLADRVWVCESCGSVHDRDFNASINILRKGIEELKSLGGASSNNGENVRLSKESSFC
jgi:putative transposase